MHKSSHSFEEGLAISQTLESRTNVISIASHAQISRLDQAALHPPIADALILHLFLAARQASSILIPFLAVPKIFIFVLCDEQLLDVHWLSILCLGCGFVPVCIEFGVAIAGFKVYRVSLVFFVYFFSYKLQNFIL